jgi:hypothetical protein
MAGNGWSYGATSVFRRDRCGRRATGGNDIPIRLCNPTLLIWTVKNMRKGH